MLDKLAFDCLENGTALISFDFPAYGENSVNEKFLTIENCKKDLSTVLIFWCKRKRFCHKLWGIHYTAMC